MAWRLSTCGLLILLSGLLSGCGGPVGVYHDVEGGAIAQSRQAPPGADMPYPNLASVPPAPAADNAVTEAAASSRIAGTAPAGVSPASPGALAGLELPAAAPPVPTVETPIAPGSPAPALTPPAVAAAKPAPSAPASVPVQLAFAPDSAVLDHDAAVALRNLAAGAGKSNVLVGGFGDAAGPADAAALQLALARARRLADALTAAGIPAANISMVAAAAGSGGFVQLVY